MKYLLLLLGICLLGCKGQSTKQEIMVLSPYLEVDTTFTKDANQTMQIVSEALGGANDDEAYYRNILHVDSVIKQCIVYVKQNQPKQLLDLFDKEKVNIYGHPSNTIAHEKDLHYMILSLSLEITKKV